jgi:branched-chain amino acid transport system substrate-binding protein
MKLKQSLIFATLATAASLSMAQLQQGISKEEIVIGTMQDLSGPLAGYGKAARNGMLLRIEEINEQGGIHGRRIKLLVEDHGYDPRKAAALAEKMVKKDKIFMMVNTLGAAQNLAAMPILFEKEVINFFPLTASSEMYEPFHRLKFAINSTYHSQLQSQLPRLVKQKDVKKVCVIYQDDEFGQEIVKGAEDGLKSENMTLTEKVSFKRGATDFSQQVAKMKGAGCELVVLGTIIRETIGTIGESRKTGFNPVFLGTVASYSELIHKLGGKLVEGMYATSTSQLPYPDSTSQPVRFWANKYVTKFNEEPSVMSVGGYLAVDVFAKAMQTVGPRPTTSKYIRAMETIQIPQDMFGTPAMKFTPTRRLGSDQARLSQIQNGRWVVVNDYLKL